MEISEIIGKGKLFEPPFMIILEGSALFPCVVDMKGDKVFYTDDVFLEDRDDCVTFCQHICGLLNQETDKCK